MKIDILEPEEARRVLKETNLDIMLAGRKHASTTTALFEDHNDTRSVLAFGCIDDDEHQAPLVILLTEDTLEARRANVENIVDRMSERIGSRPVQLYHEEG